MNILVLGSGGREHTLAWKIAQSPNADKIFVAPGNAGTTEVATNLSIDLGDFKAIEQAVKEHNIELLVVGPEAPLVDGIRDYFIHETDLADLLIIGPGAKGAMLEGSKDFSKEFMLRNNVPTAGAKTISKENLDEGLSFLDSLPAPYVLKADGLAAGKGVIITENLDDAKSSLKEMLDGQFGEASSKVLIEEFLDGIELSVFVLTDGSDYLILPEAKDYKRIGEKDTGPNTGGMGAVTPVPFASEEFMGKVEETVIKPTIRGLQNEKIDYVGFIFIGLMNCGGEPKVIEYNVRMGDPETQAVLPRIKSDFLGHLVAAANGSLDQEEIEFHDQVATTVVAVAGGYPGKYEKGETISGLNKEGEAITFHAGTKELESDVITNGGRVLASTGLSDSIEGALKISYDNLSTISWQGMNYRKDIGQDLLSWLANSK